MRTIPGTGANYSCSGGNYSRHCENYSRHGANYYRFPTMVHRWHTTTTLTKCVVWCCGCCFEYPQQWQQHILTKCVVGWCCGSQHPQHHTTHFVEMCCCTVLWVLFRVPTTTHFNKMCCCMVLWVLRHTTPFTWLKCVVVGTRNNTHNTIQQHTLLMLLLCVTYDDVGVVSSTHSLHPHHFVVVCHLWWCGCCFEYPQFTPTSL